MYPETRGRMSTWLTAANRPENVSESVTVRAMTRATVTCGAGGGTAAWRACASLEQPDSVRAADNTAAGASEAKAMDRMCTMQTPCIPELDEAVPNGWTRPGENSGVEKPLPIWLARRGCAMSGGG